MTLPIVYTQSQADRDCRIWEKWIENGYPLLSDLADTNVSLWDAVRAIARNALEYTTGSISGTLDPADEMSETALNEFVITLDCCPINPSNIEALDLDGVDPRNIESIKSKYAKKVWDAVMDTNINRFASGLDECSPELFISLLSSFSGTDIISFDWVSVGGSGAVPTDTGSEQTIHMLATDLSATIYNVDGGWVEQCSFVFSVGDGADKQVFRYPTNEAYNLATIPTPALGEKVDIPIDVKVSGRLIEMPTTLGCYVVPAAPGWMNGGMMIEPGWHFAAWIMNYEYQNWLFARRQPPAENPYFCDIVPSAYQKFLSLYHDHPLITRSNIYPVIEKTPAEEQADLQYVDNHVNTTFERYIEEYENWRFMSVHTFTDGDCEDFALTKAQMLIERGWDVRRLKIEGGWYSYLGDIGGESEIQYEGHAWLVVDDSIALDSNSTYTGLTNATLDELREQYGERRVIQTNETFESETIEGATCCWWERVDTWAMLHQSAEQRMIKINPYPVIDFDMSMWDLAGEIERTK